LEFVRLSGLNDVNRYWHWYVAVLALGLLALSVGSATVRAQERVGVTQITPTVFVFATSIGNVVASVGPDGALLVGTPSVHSTPRIESFLEQHTKSRTRYVVIYPENAAQSEGDAGWGKRGAFVVMQEKALERLGGHKMGKPAPLPLQLLKLGVGRPHVSFSEVISFDLNGEAIHIVHQKPGYSDADAVTHFHVANVIYMGEVFPGDGYPRIDASQGGTLEGLLDQLAWTDPKQHIVPARGPITNGTSVKAFADMIVTVRDRVRHLVQEGKTESQVLASHPTAEFDAQWGHGRVSPDEFVREIYAAVTKK
jgi:cyclase